jgi:hypothetical protein
MTNEVKITASGAVGIGKSALLGEIENLLIVLGVPVRYEDAAAAQAEKNGTHADWLTELQATKPSVVLIEKIERAAPSIASSAPADDLPPAEHDKGMDRHYLPLPNGWEIQTKGKGSTFRICKVNGEDDYERWQVTDERLHEPLQRIAEDCRSAIAAQHAAPAARLMDEQIDAIATDYCPDAIVTAGSLRRLCRAIEAASGPNAALVAK